MSVADNIARIQERIAAAAERAGRKPEQIALMAVSKTFPVSAIRQAHAAGLRLFGENRVQEFSEKSPVAQELLGAAFHLIGHLQSNKANRAAEIFSAVDSLDSVRLAQRLDAAAAAHGKVLDVLIEINIGGEAAKTGISPESPQLEELLAAASTLQHLAFRGLMTIPPHTGDPQGARPYFCKLRQLRDSIAARRLPRVSLGQLSMGMSHDFEVAIEEGSTCVRLGTAIFGAISKP